MAPLWAGFQPRSSASKFLTFTLHLLPWNQNILLLPVFCIQIDLPLEQGFEYYNTQSILSQYSVLQLSLLEFTCLATSTAISELMMFKLEISIPSVPLLSILGALNELMCYPSPRGPSCLHPSFPAASPAAGLGACVQARKCVISLSVGSQRLATSNASFLPAPSPQPLQVSTHLSRPVSNSPCSRRACSSFLLLQAALPAPLLPKRERNFKRKTSPFHDPL